MINPVGKLVVLIGLSTNININAKTTPLASKPALVPKQPLPLSEPATEIIPTTAHDTTTDIIEKTIIPRGGDGEVGLAERLKIGSYFALWYILNIVYNSEYMMHKCCIF